MKATGGEMKRKRFSEEQIIDYRETQSGGGFGEDPSGVPGAQRFGADLLPLATEVRRHGSFRSEEASRTRAGERRVEENGR